MSRPLSRCVKQLSQVGAVATHEDLTLPCGRLSANRASRPEGLLPSPTIWSGTWMPVAVLPLCWMVVGSPMSSLLSCPGRRPAQTAETQAQAVTTAAPKARLSQPTWFPDAIPAKPARNTAPVASE